MDPTGFFKLTVLRAPAYLLRLSAASVPYLILTFGTGAYYSREKDKNTHSWSTEEKGGRIYHRISIFWVPALCSLPISVRKKIPASLLTCPYFYQVNYFSVKVWFSHNPVWSSGNVQAAPKISMLFLDFKIPVRSAWSCCRRHGLRDMWGMQRSKGTACSWSPANSLLFPQEMN